jgi:cobalt-zinc-cadmium efflux system outer membrane protein
MRRSAVGDRAVFTLGLLLALTVWDQPSALSQPAVRAGEWSIDEIVARALADNPELRAARAEVEAARGRLRQAGLRPNPMLDLGGQRNVTGPDNNLMVGLTVPLDLNGRKEGRTAVAERELEMKQAQLAERERRLRADVRMKAGESLAARRNLGFTGELLETNRRALGLIGERVRRGATPPLEESLMLVEANRLEASQQLLASRAEILALQLRALAGLPPEAPLAVQGDLQPVPLLLTASEGVARALASRPDVLAARADAALARARIAKEQAEGRWDASVNVGYQRQDFGYDLNGLTNGGGTRPIQDIFHYVGAGVTVTLPVRNRNQGNIEAAIAEAQAAERRIEFVELMVRQEIAAAFQAHLAAERARELYARGVREVARRNLDVVRRTYELGRTPLLEVIAEQRRYIDVETGYTDVVRQVYDAAVEVERAVGAPGR